MKPAEKRLPVIDPERCSGCGTCVIFCPPAALQIPMDQAVLAFPDACKSEGRCVQVCPQGAIQMEWVAVDAGRRRRVARTPRVTEVTAGRKVSAYAQGRNGR